MSSAGFLTPTFWTVQSLCTTSSSGKSSQLRQVPLLTSLHSVKTDTVIVRSGCVLLRPSHSSVFGSRESACRANRRDCYSRNAFSEGAVNETWLFETSESTGGAEDAVDAKERLAEASFVGQEESQRNGNDIVAPLPVEEQLVSVADQGAGPKSLNDVELQPQRTIPARKVWRRGDTTKVVREALIPGAVFTGRVKAIRPYGAFVDIGAYKDGLVHISKLSTQFVENVSDIVSEGQEVQVTVTSVDQLSGRISLSMAGNEDPGSKSQASSTQREGTERRVYRPGSNGMTRNRETSSRSVSLSTVREDLSYPVSTSGRWVPNERGDGARVQQGNDWNLTASEESRGVPSTTESKEKQSSLPSLRRDEWKARVSEIGGSEILVSSTESEDLQSGFSFLQRNELKPQVSERIRQIVPSTTKNLEGQSNLRPPQGNELKLSISEEIRRDARTLSSRTNNEEKPLSSPPPPPSERSFYEPKPMTFRPFPVNGRAADRVAWAYDVLEESAKTGEPQDHPTVLKAFKMLFDESTYVDNPVPSLDNIVGNIGMVGGELTFQDSASGKPKTKPVQLDVLEDSAKNQKSPGE